MKNYLISLMNQLLGKHFTIETLFRKLKSRISIRLEPHTQHQPPANALIYGLFCFAAYALAQPKVKVSQLS